MKKQSYPITQLTGGLNISVDPSFLTDADSPDILGVRFVNGLLKKELGYNTFGLPLLGVPMLIDTFYLTTGTSYSLCFTTTSVYKIHSSKREWVDITKGVVCSDCTAAWTAEANVTASNEAGIYGTDCTKLAVGATFTTGLAAHVVISSANYSTYDHVHLLIKSSVATTLGQLSLILDDTAAGTSPIENINIPALVANTWTRVSLTLAAAASDTAIISVGVKVNTDLGAMDIYLDTIDVVKEFTGTQDNLFFSTTFIDYYIVLNGKDSIQKWSGTSRFVDLAGSPPSTAKTICCFQNRLLLGGTTETGTNYPQRVRWSSAGTIETWSGGTSGYVDIMDTVDWIMHLKLLKDKCICYKDYSIWEVKYTGGTQVFLPEMKVNGTGTLAPNTIVDRGEIHSLFGNSDILDFDGTYTKVFSTKINPLLFRTGDKILDFSKIIRATSLYISELNEYWISFPTEEIIFKYNIETTGWVRHNSLNVTTLGYYDSGSASSVIWSAAAGTWAVNTYGSWRRRTLPANAPTVLLGFNTGQISEDDRSTSASTEMKWVTKDWHFGHSCKLVEVRFTYYKGGFTCYYSTDGGSTYVSLGSFS
jgi:hypothetical protein